MGVQGFQAFGLLFQVGDAVLVGLELGFQNRDFLGEVVVLMDFPGQLFQLGVGDGLLLFQLGLHPAGRGPVGKDDPDQRQAPGDDGGEDRRGGAVHRPHPFQRALSARTSMWVKVPYRPTPPWSPSNCSA